MLGGDRENLLHDPQQISRFRVMSPPKVLLDSIIGLKNTTIRHFTTSCKCLCGKWYARIHGKSGKGAKHSGTRILDAKRARKADFTVIFANLLIFLSNFNRPSTVHNNIQSWMTIKKTEISAQHEFLEPICLYMYRVTILKYLDVQEKC